MRRVFEIGGLVAGMTLVGFGIAVIVLALNGRSTVHSELKQQQIVGTADMTPSAIRAEGQKAGLPSTIDYPSCSVAGKAITDGSRARCFAQYMRIHALEASGGSPPAQPGSVVTAHLVGPRVV